MKRRELIWLVAICPLALRAVKIKTWYGCKVLYRDINGKCYISRYITKDSESFIPRYKVCPDLL